MMEPVGSVVSLFDTGVRPAIDAHLLELSKQKRDYGEYWSASSAGYCMRRNIFERLQVPYVVEDARKQRVFSSGHIFHEWIQGITKAAGLSIAQEVELQDEYLMVRGHFDDLVLVPGLKVEKVYELAKSMEGSLNDAGFKVSEKAPTQHLILYDYKTQNSKGFATYAKKPSYFHKMQLGTYMYMLRQAPSGVLPSGKYNAMHSSWLKNLTEARILKISKDDLRLAEVQYLWSDELESEIKNYWAMLNTYWDNKKIPPCTCADREGGFLAREQYNPFFYEGEPCSLVWYNKFKEAQSAAV